MQRLPSIQFIAFCGLLLTQTACTTDPKLESPQEIAAAVEPVVNDNDPSLQGPELTASRYRALFYGYDSVAYRLSAPASGQVSQFRLLLDINYGAKQARNYQITPAPPIVHTRQESVRCGVYNNFVSACLYRDRGYIDLPAADVRAAADKGISFQLQAADAQDISMELPANYIQGFLQAVDKR